MPAFFLAMGVDVVTPVTTPAYPHARSAGLIGNLYNPYTLHVLGKETKSLLSDRDGDAVFLHRGPDAGLRTATPCAPCAGAGRRASEQVPWRAFEVHATPSWASDRTMDRNGGARRLAESGSTEACSLLAALVSNNVLSCQKIKKY